MTSDKEKLEGYVNTLVTVVVLHPKSGRWVAKETFRRYARKFAEACVEKFTKDSPEELQLQKDLGKEMYEMNFNVIEIDWSNKHLVISKLSDLGL